MDRRIIIRYVSRNRFCGCSLDLSGLGCLVATAGTREVFKKG